MKFIYSICLFILLIISSCQTHYRYLVVVDHGRGVQDTLISDTLTSKHGELCFNTIVDSNIWLNVLEIGDESPACPLPNSKVLKYDSAFVPGFVTCYCFRGMDTLEHERRIKFHKSNDSIYFESLETGSPERNLLLVLGKKEFYATNIFGESQYRYFYDKDSLFKFGDKYRVVVKVSSYYEPKSNMDVFSIKPGMLLQTIYFDKELGLPLITKDYSYRFIGEDKWHSKVTIRKIVRVKE